MSTITYTISQNFGGNIENLQESQLMTQILASNISSQCINVSRFGDNVNIVFTGILAGNDITTLNSIISNFVAIPPPLMSTAYIDPTTQLITHTVNNVPYKFLGNQSNEVVISKGTQGYYSSIYTAINANNNPNTIYSVYPGTYNESHPITLPAGSVLKGMGTFQNTKIVSMNPNQPVIVLGAGAAISDIMIYGANLSGGEGIYLDCTQSGGQGLVSSISRVVIMDCNIGVEVTNKNASTLPDSILMMECAIRTKAIETDTGIYIHSGGAVMAICCQLTATATYPIDYGVYVTDPGSKINMATANTSYLNNGIFVDNGGFAQIVLILLNNPGIGLIVGANGSGSSLIGDNFFVSNSTTYDLQVLSNNASIQFMADALDYDKIYNPNNVSLNLRYNGTKFGQSFQGTIGNVQFGTASSPTITSFGQGQYVTSGTVVMSNTNLTTGSWVDNSIAANLVDSSYFNIYGGTSANNCLYIGSPYPILGFEIKTITPTTNLVLSTDVVLEYWNGTSWISFNIMKNCDHPPYFSYPYCFVSIADTINVRFGLNSSTPFAQLTLNNHTCYWVRSRIVNAFSSIPTADYLKLHPSTKLLNGDGWGEYFGDCRPITDLIMPNFMSSNSTVTDQEVFVSSNLSVLRGKNFLSVGNLTRIGTNAILPKNLDNSFPLKFEMAFVVDATPAGNIYFTVRFGTTTSTNPLYTNVNNAPTNPPGNMFINVTIPITANSNNQDLRQKFYININYVNPNPIGGNTNLFWITIERNATNGNGNDTYPGNVIVTTIKSEHVAWNDGSHILSY
jgi:hypothetical protein